jgi:hypothetical protein
MPLALSRRMRAMHPMARRVALCAALAARALAAPAEEPAPSIAGGPAPPTPPILFEPGPPPTRSGAIEALAYEPASGRLALGGARGAWLREHDGRFETILARGVVHALAFAEDGALWLATGNGLLLRDREGRLLDRTPAPGAAARAVTSLAAVPTALAVGSADGVHVSSDGQTWQRVADAAPDAPASGLALRAREGWLELWWIARGSVWRARLAREGTRLVVVERGEERPFGGVAHAEPVQVALDLAGVDVVVVSADTIAWRTNPAAAWRSVPLVGLPGASVRRLDAAAGRLWLATDRGLLEGPGPEGPWRRAAPPAGGEPAFEVAGDARHVFVGTAAGLLEGRLARANPRPLLDALPLANPRPAEPEIGEVQRAALLYLDLGPEHVRRLRRGVALRGLLPLVTLDLDRSRGRDASRDWDQSFVSGNTHQLFDRGRSRSHDSSATLRFTWDLGDAAYHPEEIDLSKEARELIELRDDVLDEVTQLYFERRRVLLELAALGPAGGLEVARLQLRADELAAQLDAWTGGWFGRHAPPLVPRRFTP